MILETNAILKSRRDIMLQMIPEIGVFLLTEGEVFWTLEDLRCYVQAAQSL